MLDLCRLYAAYLEEIVESRIRRDLGSPRPARRARVGHGRSRYAPRRLGPWTTTESAAHLLAQAAVVLGAGSGGAPPVWDEAHPLRSVLNSC